MYSAAQQQAIREATSLPRHKDPVFDLALENRAVLDALKSFLKEAGAAGNRSDETWAVSHALLRGGMDQAEALAELAKESGLMFELTAKDLVLVASKARMRLVVEIQAA